MKKKRDKDNNDITSPIYFVNHEEDWVEKAFTPMEVNSQSNYAILKTSDGGRYIRGNMLFYKYKGVEIYTEINNIIFVDEDNDIIFVREFNKAIDEIVKPNSQEDPEQKQYVVLYTDLSDDDGDCPLRWESYIGRMTAYEAIKTNAPVINPEKSIILAGNASIADALTVKEFVDYLKNAQIVDDDFEFDMVGDYI